MVTAVHQQINILLSLGAELADGESTQAHTATIQQQDIPNVPGFSRGKYSFMQPEHPSTAFL